MVDRRYCLILDLKDDNEAIRTYEAYHEVGKVWPEVLTSIQESGILQMEIYRFGTRLCMFMEVDDTFDFQLKATSDAINPRVQAWEKLMNEYQQTLPGSKPGEKWILMHKIFDLSDHLDATE